jgi:hypothetical protein
LVGGADLRHLGRTLAQQLVGDGELVMDVSAKLAARGAAAPVVSEG